MAKTVINYIKLGFLVTAGALIFIVSLYFIGSEKNIFGNTFTLYAVFRDVNGLRDGNNVRYGGIDVGSVNDIKIENDTVINVEMVIDEKLLKVISKNSIASVGTDGLMGDKLVNIESGEPGAAAVEDGDTIVTLRGVNTEEMLRTLEFTNQNVAIVSANLKSLTETINKSRGTLYTVLMDTTLADHLHTALNNIEAASNYLNHLAMNLSTASDNMNQGKGLLGVLVKDTSAANDLRNTMSKINSSGEQLNNATRNMEEAMQKLNTGNGTIQTMLSDTGTANHLKRAIENIDSSAYKLNENLEALKHSWLLRRYFKKKGN